MHFLGYNFETGKTHAAEVANCRRIVSEEPLLLPAHEGHHFCKISILSVFIFQDFLICREEKTLCIP